MLPLRILSTALLPALLVLGATGAGVAAAPLSRTGNPLLAQASASEQAPSFPLRAVKRTEFPTLGVMETSITVSRQGRLTGSTRTWGDPSSSGFRGAATVVLTDQGGNPLYVSQTRKYGAGSTGRTWSETLPADILPRIAGYLIYQVAPPDNLPQDWIRSAEGQRIVRLKYSAFPR